MRTTFAFAAIVVIATFAQAQTPQKVELCELIQNAVKYDHQEIEVRAQVNEAFEDFTLEGEKCGDWTKYRPVWLTYGSDQPGPTPSTTNDNTRQRGQYLKINGKVVPLVRDQSLELFKKRLFAARYVPNDALQCWDRACNFYRVTATLRGIFLAASGKSFEGKSYGHLGCCNLLAIEQVSDVDAVRTAVPAGGEYKCSEEEWKIDDATLTRFTRRQQCAGFRDCQIVWAEYLAQIAEHHWNDRIDPHSGSYPAMEHRWISEDLLKSYAVTLPDRSKKKNKAENVTVTQRTCVAIKPPLPASTPIVCNLKGRTYSCTPDTAP
jgi:hypothetical protein